MRILLALSVLVAAAGTARAGKLPCTSELSCARACSAKNPRACKRLESQLLESMFINDEAGGDTYAWLDPAAARAARTSLAKVCTARQDRSCVVLGELEELGLGGAADAENATTRYTAACDAGDGAGCFALGQAHLRGTVTGSSAITAYRQFERACRFGYALGCGKVGLAVGYGYGTPEDRARGLELLTESCEKHDDALSCVWLGDVRREGAFGEANVDLADAAYARACELGSWLGCEAAAPRVSTADQQRSLHAKACDLGAVASCIDAAKQSKEDAAAVRWYERACAIGGTEACLELAFAHRDGRLGLKKNLKKARKHAARACKDGGDYECVQEAVLEIDDEKRRKQTIAALEKLCTKKNAQACNVLGRAYQDAAYFGLDLERARAYLEKECAITGRSPCKEATDVTAWMILEADRAQCDRDDGAACQRFVESAHARAEWLATFEKTCAAKYDRACMLRDEATFLTSRDAALLASSATACEAWDPEACWFVLRWSQDPAQRVAAGVSTCKAHGDLEACKLTCDLDTASVACAVRDELLCDRGDLGACTEAGHRTTDRAAALAIWDKACARKSPHACFHAGDLRLDTDPDRARAELTFACEHADAKACAMLKSLADK